MSLNYNTELALINTTANSGTITLPSAITVPGRVISFKDSAGNFNNKSVTLICDGSDTFEDGTTQKVFYESFGSIQVVASGIKWFILSGVRQNSMTISSLITSTISTYSISFSDGSFQTVSADKSINSSIIGLGTFGYISTSQLFSTTTGLVDHLELNSSIAGLGSLGYLSSFNSISSLNISSGNIFANIFTTRSISTNFISTGNLFGGTVSSQQMFTSSIRTNRAFIDRLAPLFDSGTNTANLYPASAGAQLGFFGSAGTNSGGFYGQVNVRSTITQVIVPDIVGAFSNNIRIQGNVSTQNVFVSTINRKQYPYASTIGIPASTFTLSGAAANIITAPLVLYSNVSFPHAGFFNITQSAIFSRTNATANVPQASIFYTPGIYPSTIGNVDGYASLPYLGNANASTFTTVAETLYVSTTQLTRNIIYSDPTGNAYTANLFMSPITLNYIPNNTLNPE